MVNTDINKEIAHSFKENKKKSKKIKRSAVDSKNNTIKKLEKVFYGHNPVNISKRKSTRERPKTKQKKLKPDINNIKIKRNNKSVNTKVNDNEINEDNNINNMYDDNYLAKEKNDEECIII